jgi:RNA polymerase sigma factor (sigma-70 family)
MTPSRPIPEPGDEALAAAANVAALYDRYAHRLLPFLDRLGVARASIEDVHHDVWVRVCKALAERPFHGHFRGWLFAVARNLVTDRKRKQHEAQPLPVDLLDQHGQQPLAGLLGAEQQALLQLCLERLAHNEASVFRLRLAGAEYAEVCEQVGVDVKGAYRLFEEAKRKLIGCVQKAQT